MGAWIAFLAAVLALGTFVILVLKKSRINSSFLILLSFTVFLYLAGNYIEIANTILETSVVGLQLRYVGDAFVPVLWYLCVAEFCGIKFKQAYTYVLLLFIPALTACMALAWPQTRLLFESVVYANHTTQGNVIVIPGVLYGLRSIFHYGINVFGLLTLAYCYKKGTKRFKRQVFLFFFSALIPLANTTTFTVNNSGIDITPYFLSVSMALFANALYRHGLFNQTLIIKSNAMNHLLEGVLLFDSDGIFMDANDSARDIFPQVAHVLLGMHIDDMDYLPFTSAVFQEMKGQNNKKAGEFTRLYGNETKTFNISVSPIHLKKRKIGYSIILNNITPLKKLLTELEVQSSTDALTNIYNRRYLFDAGESIVQTLKYSNEPFCAIMFDLDFFKMANDTYGHVFGDYVLKTVASICSASLRSTDIFGRYGGEEFCVLLPNTPIEGACVKAEALRQKISAHPFELGRVKTSITASFGVAVYAEPCAGSDAFSALIKRADEQMYRAKENGRNQVC